MAAPLSLTFEEPEDPSLFLDEKLVIAEDCVNIVITNKAKESQDACDDALRQGASADQAEPTQKRTDLLVLTNKLEIAERKRDNIAQRIQQLKGLRTPAQQNVSADAQQSLDAGAMNTSQTGQNTTRIAINAGGGGGRRNWSHHVHFQNSPQKTSSGSNPQPASTRNNAKKPITGGLAEGHHGKEAWIGGNQTVFGLDFKIQMRLTFRNQLKCSQAVQKPLQVT